MDGSHGSCGSSRRRFLKVAAATGAAATSISAEVALAAPEEKLPTITLGKTGATVTRLGMGTSWTVQPVFVQTAIAQGVRYIDTAEGYESGNSEKTVGLVLERTGKRKDVFLVTKNSGYRRAQGPGATKIFEERLNKSLERLRTDYVDAYYLHGLTGEQIPMLFDPGVKAAFEQLKKAGKIRFAGLSCHDKRLVEVVEAAAKCGWLDQIMIQYNYRTMDADTLRRAIDLASKANLGLVAMKTQGGAGSFREIEPSPKFAQFREKGFNQFQAAIKAVLTDERIHLVVSEMTNRDQLRENMAAVREPLTSKEARLLEEHRQKTAHLYCHGCGHLCETAAKGVPVATVLRYLRYYSVYGKRAEARALYQALPPEARDLATADLAAAEAACPYGLPVTQLVQIADRKLG
ncbi:MAG: aldo/keto reductase [Isosphaeraceae bacterium]|nr:aldo/keto reductase [Isosphaeraceae bacterium]